MEKKRRALIRGIFFGVVFFAVTTFVAAQPAMSRGEQLLAISYDECMRRAEGIFTTEGWGITNKGSSFILAARDIHGACIMCNAGPDNKTWVNIVVASTTQDGNVPGAERIKLQNRMGQAVANNPPANSFAGTWDGISGDGRFREVWTIKDENGRWVVFGGLYNRQTGQQMGGFYTENIRFQNGALAFRMVFNPKPDPNWPNTVEFSSVTVNGDSLSTRHAHGSGSFTRRR